MGPNIWDGVRDILLQLYFLSSDFLLRFIVLVIRNSSWTTIAWQYLVHSFFLNQIRRIGYDLMMNYIHRDRLPELVIVFTQWRKDKSFYGTRGEVTIPYYNISDGWFAYNYNECVVLMDSTHVGIWVYLSVPDTRNHNYGTVIHPSRRGDLVRFTISPEREMLIPPPH